jgi:hypothetical protein
MLYRTKAIVSASSSGIYHSYTKMHNSSMICLMEKNDNSGTAGKIEQDKASSSQAANTSHQSKAANGDSNNDNNNTIIIVNDRNTVQRFIERSPLGVQFAIIVLFYLARAYRSSTDIRKAANWSDGSINISGISFTSKDFFNTYSELASEMGLTKYLVRHMAFAEFILTMEYLALVREDEHTANYRFAVDYDDLKWLASISLQQIAGGQSLSSPETFYPSSSPSALISGAAQPDKAVNTPATVNSSKANDLIKDLSQSIFSREETMVRPGGSLIEFLLQGIALGDLAMTSGKESLTSFLRGKSVLLAMHRYCLDSLTYGLANHWKILLPQHQKETRG